MKSNSLSALLCARISLRRMSLAALVFAVAIASNFIFSIPQHAQSVTLDAEEQAFLTLINNYRQQNGLSTLQASVTLTNAAKWMSGDMAAKNYFSHTDSLGRDPFTRMAAFGYNYNTYMGENIAAGYSDAANTFNQWKNSSGHNANMLNPNYKVIGIGRVANLSSTYRYYWTTGFGGYVDQVISGGGTPTPTPTPTPTATPTPRPSATPTPTPTPTPTTVALLNPSFESGLANWTTSGYVYYTTSYVTSGSYAGLLYASNTVPSSIFQWVQLTAGATYELSGDVTAPSVSQPTLGVRWDNYADGPSVRYTGGGARQTIKARFTVPAGSGRVGVYFKNVGTTSSYYWAVIDNLKLVRVS